MFLPNLGCYMGNTWILNRRCLTKIGNMINKHGIVRARQLSWKWWISTALTYHKPIPWHRATDQFRGGITVQEPISAEKYVYLGGGQNRKYVIFIRYNMYKTWDINNIYYKSGGQNTYYPQGTWPKWVVPYRLWMCSHKFEHPMSTSHYFRFTLIVPVTHI